MKLFKLLTTTAITTMAVAAMSVSASAADEITANYSYDSTEQVGTIELSGLDSYKDTQLTLLVLSDNVNSITEENKEVIKQIDQGTNSEIAAVNVADLSPDAANQTLLNTYNAALATYEASDKGDEAFAAIETAWNTLDAAWAANSESYYVRVGGTQDADGKYIILADDFTVATTLTKPTKPTAPSTGGGEEPPVSQWGMGDVDRDAYVGSLDAEMVLDAEVYIIELDEEQTILADVDEDMYVGSLDAEEILNFEVYIESALDKFYPDRF